MSLQEAQTKELKVHPENVRTIKGFKRALEWRPLRQSDFEDKAAPSTGTQYFHAAAEDSVDYYWKQ